MSRDHSNVLLSCSVPVFTCYRRTSAESVHVLIKLEPNDCAIMVDDVRLAVPGTRHHLFSAVTLHTHTHTRVYNELSYSSRQLFIVCYVIETRDTRVSHRTTDRDVQFLQCKELVIHLHRPQELLRAVHKLQGTCTNKNTRYITGDKTPRRVIIRDLTPKNIHCTSVLVRFQRYLSISQGSPPPTQYKVLCTI